MSWGATEGRGGAKRDFYLARALEENTNERNDLVAKRNKCVHCISPKINFLLAFIAARGWKRHSVCSGVGEEHEMDSVIIYSSTCGYNLFSAETAVFTMCVKTDFVFENIGRTIYLNDL